MMSEKSKFAVTCSLLSQYIKGGGSLADLCMAPPRPLDPAARAIRPPTTMSLLPGANVPGGGSMDLFPQRAGFNPSAPPAAADVRAPEKAQLTIFYGGKVLVFDNFPSEKASDLMQLASKGSSTAQNFRFPLPPSSSDAGPTHGTSTFAPAPTNPPAAVQDRAQMPPQPSTSYLPIARKASLHRFLEKRKDRVSAKAPYPANGSTATVKPEERQPWLGLGPQTSKPSLSSECIR